MGRFYHRSSLLLLGSQDEERRAGIDELLPIRASRRSPQARRHSDEGRSNWEPRPSARGLWTSSGRCREPMTLNC